MGARLNESTEFASDVFFSSSVVRFHRDTMLVWDPKEVTERCQRSFEEFKQIHGLKEVIDLEQIGPQRACKGNGNCGYEAIICNAWYHGRLESLIAQPSGFGDGNIHLTQQDRDEDLRLQLLDMNMFRWKMAQFYQRNRRSFRQKEGHDDDAPCFYQMADGKPAGPFKGELPLLKSRITNKIWSQGVDFTHGCTVTYWADLDFTFAIAAKMLKVSCVVYTKGSRTRRYTHFFYYDKALDRVTLYVQGKAYVTPTPNAMCFVFNGENHYDLLDCTILSLGQVYYGVRNFMTRQLPTKSTKPGHAERKAKAMFLRMVGSNDLTYDSSSDDSNDEVPDGDDEASSTAVAEDSSDSDASVSGASSVEPSKVRAEMCVARAILRHFCRFFFG